MLLENVNERWCLMDDAMTAPLRGVMTK